MGVRSIGMFSLFNLLTVEFLLVLLYSCRPTSEDLDKM